jgi:hypothetical protein
VEAASNELTQGASDLLDPLLDPGRQEVLERAEGLGMACLAILNDACHYTQAVIDCRDGLLNGNGMRILLYSHCQRCPSPELECPILRGLEDWALEYRVPWELHTPEH